jgi:hypothetical protein
MTTSLLGAKDSLDALARLISADYGKLRYVGERANCPSGDESCLDWRWTEQERALSSDAIALSFRQRFWEMILPLKYQANSYGEARINDLRCSVTTVSAPDFFPIKFDWNPFKDESDAGQVTYELAPGIRSSLGLRTKADLQPFDTAITPSQELLEPLFQTPAEQGLGLYKPSFYMRAFGYGTGFACPDKPVTN